MAFVLDVWLDSPYNYELDTDENDKDFDYEYEPIMEEINDEVRWDI